MDFTTNEWLFIGLFLLLGLLLGAAATAGGGRKHKVRYQEETRRLAELQTENDRLRTENDQLRKDMKTAEIDAVSARARAPVDRA